MCIGRVKTKRYVTPKMLRITEKKLPSKWWGGISVGDKQKKKKGDIKRDEYKSQSDIIT